jgi:hypothetical protein
MPDASKSFDLNALRYEPLVDRPSKISLADLGRPGDGMGALKDWIDGLPRVLAADSLKQLCKAIVLAKSRGSHVLAALGGHVIKTGCGPYLNDWMRRGVLTGVHLNGSAAIHDLELAIAGHTSEDVGPRLANGTFGFAQETSDLFVAACNLAAKEGFGLGRALGTVILEHGGPGLDFSVLVAARRYDVLTTVHVAVGTDIVHMTPKLDGSALGAASLTDFRDLCARVAQLERGVWLNLGSAVVMP